MFPRLTERLGTALDMFVEFSTLGEYGSGDSPTPDSSNAPPAAVSHVPGLGGAGGGATGRSRARRSIAGATAGCSPAAAARSGNGRRPSPDAPEQVCRAVR